MPEFYTIFALKIVVARIWEGNCPPAPVSYAYGCKLPTRVWVGAPAANAFLRIFNWLRSQKLRLVKIILRREKILKMRSNQ